MCVLDGTLNSGSGSSQLLPAISKRSGHNIQTLIQALAEAEPGVERIGPPLTMQLGPEQVRHNLEVQFQRNLPAAEVMLAVDHIAQAIRRAHPEIKRIFTEAEALKT